MAFSYNALLSVATTWFPDKRGFANGVCTCGGGMGPVIFAPIGNLLIESFNVMIAFRIVGIAWLGIYLLFTWFLVMPRAGWKPSGWSPQGTNCNLGRVFSTQLQRSGDLEATFILCSLSYIDGCCYEWTDDQRARVKPRSRARKSYCS